MSVHHGRIVTSNAVRTWVAVLLGACVASAPTPAVAQSIEQLTDDAGGACISTDAAISTDGSVVAFDSDCDPLATNADGNRELFVVDGAGLRQVTDTSGCTNAGPTVDEDGTRVAVSSDCNLALANADGNVEIFLVELGVESDTFTQLTNSLDCSSLAPSITAAGDRVAFDSDCNHTGANFVETGQIFQSSDVGVITQLTTDQTGGCDSALASIDADGDTVVFESDCDLTGANEDFALSVFRSVSSVIEQLTPEVDDSCMSTSPRVAAAGTRTVFSSDCDFTGANADGGEEIFAIDDAAGIVQLTDDDGATLCASVLPQVSADGSVVAYTSFCDPFGQNGDGSFEVFQLANLDPASIVQTTEVTATNDALCASVATAATAETVLVASDCDLTGGNADASTEIFAVSPCFCGIRVSDPPDPTASDALFILKAAVDMTDCPLCACDVDDSGGVVATDALATLKAAVGQDVTLTCPAS